MGRLRALVLLLAAGCLGMAAFQPREVQLLQQARYGELERMMRAEIPDPAAARFERLFYLCFAHSRVKRYGELFSCAAQLQRRVDAGDYKLFVFDFSAAPALLRAEAHIDLGDYPRALAEARRAYDLVKGPGAYLQFRIYAITALGLGHALNGEADAARRLAAELEAVSTAYPNTLLATDKYTGLAKIYLALGDYAAALTAIERDRETEGFRQLTDFISGAGAAGGSLHTYWVLPKSFMLAKAQLETGAIAAAREGFDRLLQLPQVADSGDLYWLLLYDRGRIAEKEGRTDEAIEYYRRAVEAIERQRATINTEASKIGFAGDKQAVYGALVAALLGQGRHEPAFEYVERAKSRALVDMLAAKQDFAVGAGNAEQLRALLAMGAAAEAEARVQSEVGAGPSQSRSAALRARTQLAEQAPELASLVSVSAVAAREIQARLDADEVLLEYYRAGGALYAFVVTRDALRGLRLEGEGLEAEVRQFRKALQDPASGLYLERAQRLHRRLVAPLAAAPPGRPLLVVPHGALHYLPFGALHDGSGYLIERHGIRVLPAAGVLRYLRQRPAAQPGAMLALGNPDLGEARLELAHAEAEARTVAQAMPPARALLRKEATETAFRQNAGGFAYLHLASHGEFNADAPLRSALLLARDAQNDGALTADELYTLRLDAELVTLSACETGLGKVFGGDDVVGLTRGFLYAGAAAVVASLWQVDDLATSRLMTRFYANLKTVGKREALRRAQLETMRSHPHPFFWAAFQLTGSAR